MRGRPRRRERGHAALRAHGGRRGKDRGHGHAVRVGRPVLPHEGRTVRLRPARRGAGGEEPARHRRGSRLGGGEPKPPAIVCLPDRMLACLLHNPDVEYVPLFRSCMGVVGNEGSAFAAQTLHDGGRGGPPSHRVLQRAHPGRHPGGDVRGASFPERHHARLEHPAHRRVRAGRTCRHVLGFAQRLFEPQSQRASVHSHRAVGHVLGGLRAFAPGGAGRRRGPVRRAVPALHRRDVRGVLREASAGRRARRAKAMPTGEGAGVRAGTARAGTWPHAGGKRCGQGARRPALGLPGALANGTARRLLQRCNIYDRRFRLPEDRCRGENLL